MRRLLIAAALAIGVVSATALPAAAAPGPADSPQWWFDTWNLPSLWAAGARGQGIVIAEIDTGVNGALRELTGNLLPGTDFGDPGHDGQTDHELNAFGHGTAMASLMVGRPGVYGLSGAAPDAKLLPIAVPIRGTDDARAVGSDQVPQAIRWAADHNGKIISLSLGGRRSADRDELACPQDEQDAITYAISKGSVVVAASGNSGEEGSPVEDPGVCLGVVSVGAVDADGQVASFSSRHPYLTLTAPGVAIPSLGRVPGAAYVGDGTSQATALTSAALALVWSKYPQLSGRDVVARVLATLDHRSATSDPAYGYGTVDPRAAITATLTSSLPNPVFAALDPFVARAQAQAAVATPPAAVVVQPRPAGQVAIGPAPGSVPGAGIVGIVLGGLGVLALVVLMVVGVRVRRQHRATLTGITPPPVPLAYPQSADGTVWYEVTAPEEPEAAATDPEEASSAAADRSPESS